MPRTKWPEDTSYRAFLQSEYAASGKIRRRDFIWDIFNLTWMVLGALVVDSWGVGGFISACAIGMCILVQTYTTIWRFQVWRELRK